jgi:RNA polymerase sigma-54 factor
MALTAKLELRQGQQLVMTPQLQQAIRLLQLSNLELGQFVETELERNPLLEMDDTPEAAPKAEREAEPETPSERSEQAGDDEWLDLGKPVAEADGGIDGDYDGAFVDNGACASAATRSRTTTSIPKPSSRASRRSAII